MPWGAVAGAIVGGAISSNASSKASKRSANATVAAAEIQADSADKAIGLQRESRDLARADLQPYAEVGRTNIESASRLVNDPNAQSEFIQQNPFYKLLADDAQNRLFANQAAKGKVGSGGTARALQNSLLLLGNDLLNQRVGQQLNLATIGQNAAAGQGTAALNTGNSISDLITGSGNAQAAGVVGSANAQNAGTVAQANLISNSINDLAKSYFANQNTGGYTGTTGQTNSGLYLNL